MSRKPSPRIETQLVHAGEHKPRFAGAAVLPIFQSSVFEFPDARMEKSNYHDLLYPRLNNLPNHKVLGDKLAALEACEEAFVSASGMAAISAALLTVPGEGGHVLVQPGVYGGTHNLLSDDFGDLGLSFDLLEGEDPAQWARQLRPQTRAIYVEALTNPRLQILDHAAVVQFAKAHGLVSIIDNTFATPVNFQPRLLGYDLVLHSATKYLNGHSDLTAGVVAGSREWVEKVRKRLNHFGGNLDAHACFLLHRGLKTLALRVRHQNETAQRLAEYLESHARVRQVSYPGLASHPQYARGQAWFRGFGGVLSFELEGGVEAACRLIERLELAVHGPSLGGPETLISRPATSSHSGMSAEERARAGVSESLVRVSVGLEACDDLIEDFAQALEA